MLKLWPSHSFIISFSYTDIYEPSEDANESLQNEDLQLLFIHGEIIIIIMHIYYLNFYIIWGGQSPIMHLET